MLKMGFVSINLIYTKQVLCSVQLPAVLGVRIRDPVGAGPFLPDPVSSPGSGSRSSSGYEYLLSNCFQKYVLNQLFEKLS
jgi:hypothetical protein